MPNASQSQVPSGLCWQEVVEPAPARERLLGKAGRLHLVLVHEQAVEERDESLVRVVDRDARHRAPIGIARHQRRIGEDLLEILVDDAGLVEHAPLVLDHRHLALGIDLQEPVGALLADVDLDDLERDALQQEQHARALREGADRHAVDRDRGHAPRLSAA
jgi:hypothetical protein